MGRPEAQPSEVVAGPDERERHLTPCDRPYDDCGVCKGSGSFEGEPCASCVWRRWYNDGVAAGTHRTLEDVEANRSRESPQPERCTFIIGEERCTLPANHPRVGFFDGHDIASPNAGQAARVAYTTYRDAMHAAWPDDEGADYERWESLCAKEQDVWRQVAASLSVGKEKR